MIDFKYVTEKNFNELLTSCNKPVMAYFWTTWSSDCKKEEPVLNKIKERCEPSVEFFAVNIDECPNLRRIYNVNVLPTVVFFKDGKQTAKEAGLKSEAIYLSHITRLLG